MIKEIEKSDLAECVNVIRKSFQTVADEFGFTKDDKNPSLHTALPPWPPSQEASLPLLPSVGTWP